MSHALTFNPLISSIPLADPPLARRVDEDCVLVQDALKGDHLAFNSLVRKHGPKLHALLYQMTGSHEDADDLMQDSFARAYRCLKSFRGESSFRTWLYAIATNITRSHFKKHRVATICLHDLDPSALEDDPTCNELVNRKDPVRETGLHELQERITGAMMKLTPEHREVVVMFDIQDMSYTEISRVTGIGESTLRSRLFYAHRQLQAELSDVVRR